MSAEHELGSTVAAGAVDFDHSRPGDPAPVTRLFGWGMLGILAAFVINNALIVGWGYPGATAVLSDFSLQALINAGVYAVCLLGAAYFVISTPYRSLRLDSLKIHNFNAYIIRACFWAVLLCGIVDAVIALGRVEGFLPGIVGADIASNLGRAQYVGPYVHIPLILLGMVVAVFSRTLGFHWLALMIVVAELGIVLSRFIFSYEQALMGDLVRYWYAALFLFASAYTLFEEGHVRVDVLYAGFGKTTKGFCNAWGSILLGMSTAWVIIWIGLNGKTSIINSPVMNFEVTQSGSTGMYIKYQMAAFLAIFAITMLIQFVSYLFESVADWRDQPGRREATPIAH
jgi:TRAP-type mannitol/chloroaromatic compound transport system permease small subunit